MISKSCFIAIFVAALFAGKRKSGAEMKSIILASLSILLLWSVTFAQERNWKPVFRESPDSLVLSQPKYHTGLEVGTSFMTDLKGGYGIQNYVSPKINYQLSKSLNLDFEATMGSLDFHRMNLFDYYYTTRRITGSSPYFNVAGQGTYRVNDKFFLSSAAFMEQNPILTNGRGQLENKMNFGGSFSIGYKISDKVSMQAGFGIERINDPWNVNPFQYNNGFMP